mgnify:CR=1 FL=1
MSAAFVSGNSACSENVGTLSALNKSRLSASFCCIKSLMSNIFLLVSCSGLNRAAPDSRFIRSAWMASLEVAVGVLLMSRPTRWVLTENPAPQM